MLKELEIVGAVSVFAGGSAYAAAVGAGLSHEVTIGAAAGGAILLVLLGTMLWRCL